MKPEIINMLAKSHMIRPKQLDKLKLISLLTSIETNMNVVKNIKLTKDSATVIYRETYESIRQLGDAHWWILGYEPSNHEVSIDILKEAEIKNKILLNHLSRIKQIRHDANYRAFIVEIDQTKEILDFWNLCGEEILNILKEKYNKK